MFKRIFKWIFYPRPSFFDLCVGGMLIIPWLGKFYNKSLFLVFYTAFLILLSLSLKPKREYRSLPLSLLAIWSLFGLFIHSFVIYSASITKTYLTFYLMVEGFLYIFFGVLFLKTVITYSTNIRYIYILIPFSIIPWYSGLVYVGSMTPIAALALSVFIYFILSRKIKLAFASGLLGLGGVIWKWSWLTMKFACRPYVWKEMFVDMFYRPIQRFEGDIVDVGIEFSPWFDKFLETHNLMNIKPWLASIFGGGFQQILNNYYIWVTKDNYGWLYKHSDYLSIGRDLGIIALILVVWFVIESFKKIGIQPSLILFMAIVLMCGFQVTMYIPDRAGIYLMIGALAIIEGIRRKT